MPAILTLTMNPAVDLSTTTDVVVPTEKLRCSSPALDPGGGGINVARVVTRLRGTAHAIYPRGGPTGDLLDRLVADEGISIRPVPVEGMTRYSFTVDERKSGDQFRFVLPGPALREREWRAVLDQIGGPEREGALLVLSGSLPPGVPDDFHARVAGIARERGFRIVLDSSGPALQQAVAAGVWLIKPNREEFEKLVGLHGGSDDELVKAARDLVGSGRVGVVLISLGSQGALLVEAGRHRFFRPPPVKVVSAVGAGDSLVGGLVVALDRGSSLAAAACYGIAAGTATLATPGTGLCRREDVERFFERICRSGVDMA